MINKELKLRYIKSLKSGGKVPKYLTAWGKLDKKNELDDWSNHWLYRATNPSAKSKIVGGWKPGSRNGHVESDKEYTARRIKEEQDAAKKKTKYIRRAADTAHMIGTIATGVGTTGLLLTNPVTTLGAIAGGISGEKAVDWGLGKLADMTGSKVRNWKDLTDKYLGWSPTLLMLTNPGTLLGGAAGAKGAQLGKGAMDYLIAMDMARYGYTPTTPYYFKPGYLGMNSSAIGKVPEGAKIVGEFKGEPLIEINGKKYLLSKYNELHGGTPNLGYDPEVMSLEIIALENNPTISRIIDSDKKLTDAATLVKNKKATVKVATGNSKLREPNGRNLVTMLYLDNVEGPKTRGVGLVSTEPIEDMTVTSGNKYISNGKYNRIAASATDSEQGAFKYGRINYPAIENYLKINKVLSDSEKNTIGDIIKLLKELEKLADVSTEPGNTNGRVRFWKYDKNGKKIKVGDHYLRDEDLELKYKFLLKQLNDKLPGTFEYGGKNREIIYTAPNNRQILTTTTDNPNFSTRDVVVNGLEVRNYMGQPVSKFKTKIVDNNLDIAGSGRFNNMPDIEGTLGGYKVENKKFPGTFDIHDGYSQLLNVQRRLAEKPGWSSIFLGYDFNKPMRLYIRGTGPNPEAGMTTLSIPNGATPSLKQGNKIINRFKYVSKIKKRN